MLDKSRRFHGYGSLRGVYSRGTTIRGSLLSLKVSYKANSRPYRAAVVVSRKVSKSAVIRNRIRRRIYEIVRLEGGKLDGHDLVFTAFSEQLADLEADKLNVLVLELLQKALKLP